MQKIIPVGVLSLLIISHGLGADFISGAAADRVLGQVSFMANFANDSGTSRGFNEATGIAVDPLSGKLFVSDFFNDRILRFSNAAALANNAPAEAVLGQINFSSVDPATSQTGLSAPYGIHVDSAGRLWVADGSNNRVLMWEAASHVGNGAPADKVFGQPNFNTAVDAAGSTGMDLPTDVFVDDSDRLWVVDYFNSRVLRFDNISLRPNGAAADGVLGQPDFASTIAGVSASRMQNPAGIVGDAAGRIWVADYFNNRVLRFDGAATLANGASASQVLGQPDFETAAFGTTSTKMALPVGLTLASDGTLWVPDSSNSRVLGFASAATLPNGAAATVVLGQPNFTTAIAGTSATQMSDPFAVAVDLAGHLWVAETNNNRALRFSPTPAPDPTPTPAPDPTPTPTPTPDLTAPNLKFKGKVPRQTRSARLRIRGSATDQAGSVTVQVRLNNRVIKTLSTRSAWAVRARLQVGRNRIQVTATDNNGNVSRIASTVRRSVR